MAGCWIHAKRSFAEYVKATGTEGLGGTVAAQAVNLISEIFHLDHQCGDCLAKKREEHRQLVVKPRVDAFFAWVKDTMPKFLQEATPTRAFSTASTRKSSCASFFPMVLFQWTIMSRNMPSVHLHSVGRTGSTWTPYVVLRQVPFYTAWSRQQKRIIFGYMNILNTCSMSSPDTPMIKTRSL